MELDLDLISDYEKRLRDITSALAISRRTVTRTLAEGVDFDADEHKDQNVLSAADAYIKVSEKVGVAVVEGVRKDQGSASPKEALSRLAANLAGDLKVATDLLRLSAQPETEEDLGFLADLMDVHGRQALSDLRESTEVSVDLIVGGLRGLGLSGSQQTATDFASLKNAAESILDRTGGALSRVLGVMALSETQIDSLVGTVFGAPFVKKFDEARKAVVGFFKFVMKKALDVLELITRKLAGLLGAKTVEQWIEKIKGGIKDYVGSRPGSTTAGKALGAVLNIDGTMSACQVTYDSLTAEQRQDRVPRAIAASMAASDRLSPIGWGIAGLAFCGKISFFTGGPGLVIVELVGLTLAAYVFWLAHDHLDALAFDFLPDHVIGVRRALE